MEWLDDLSEMIKVGRQVSERMREVARIGKPDKGLIFNIYPPNQYFNYWHYGNGFRAWGDYPIEGKIRLIVSLIALAVSIIAVMAS